MAKKDPASAKPDKTKEGLTPLMQQYHEIKAQNPGMVLFFRLGDFYEMFGDDALRAAPILECVLTQRTGMPMCGVPYHSVNSYIRKLIKAGEKVAICEQLEDPAAAKGIVKRGVVRVITPGTILEENLLESKQNNYLVALCPSEGSTSYGLSYVDISTGEFCATELPADKLPSELFRLRPQEIVVPQASRGNPALTRFERESGITVSAIEDWYFSAADAQNRVLQLYRLQSLKPLGLENRFLAISAAGGILSYIEKTQVSKLPSLSFIRYYSLENYLLLDATAVRNLELVEGLATHAKGDSLLDVIDLTQTPMGGRLLRQWTLQPLLSVEAIARRQTAVEFLIEEGIARRQVRETLKSVSDIERIIGRLSSGTAGPRDLVSLRLSLEAVPGIAGSLAAADPLMSVPAAIESLRTRLAVPAEVVELISRAIADEPPPTLKDGGVIREGFNAELDELRRISRDSKDLISRLEAEEKQKTGITTMRIGYTSVFGYYIEVSKSNLSLVPAHYIRKQTVTSGERFITPELKAFEEKILSAQERILRLEDRLFREVREEILRHSATLQTIAGAAAELDVFCSFAETAVQYNFTKPVIDESFELEIRDGRHPVIERRLKSGAFVSNDLYLNGSADQIILLTGPNMAGKSTYLRQVALIVVLAQMGSYVPAAKARVGVVDRIFTRIGAGDNLSGGESTFMVEMHETANILNQHTPRSLIILDEVGRGTSTYDGISIAWATIDFLARSRAKDKGPKVLFATHYFELVDLENRLPGIRNYNVAVKEWQGEVVFLHKIIEGAADRSYGIHVAHLAGLPKDVIRKANEILSTLESKPAAEVTAPLRQLDFFSAPPQPQEEVPGFVAELEGLDVNSLTPLQALQLLNDWKKALGK